MSKTFSTCIGGPRRVLRMPALRLVGGEDTYVSRINNGVWVLREKHALQRTITFSGRMAASLRHGEETNAPVALRQLRRSISPSRLRATVIISCVSTLNVVVVNA